MKSYLLPALMLICTCGFAQQTKLTDDLNKDLDKSLNKYFPSYQGEMLYSNYQLDPVHFNEKVDLARKDAYKGIKPGDPEEKLKRLDIDYNFRDVLKNYSEMYGADSAALASFSKVLTEKLKDPQLPTLLQEALRKAFPKALTEVQGKYVDSLVNSNADPNNAELFKRSLGYRIWVSGYLAYRYKTKYKSDTTFKNIKGGMPISVIIGEIQDPLVRNIECLLQSSTNLKVAKDSTLAKKIYDDFNAAVTDPYFRGKLQEVYDNFKRMHTSNAAAPDFTYAAVDGKVITLSSLRGKYVYIDIWATWCAPCKAEIPSLMEMEEEYKGKNIQFVSLSVDKQADAGKWHRYVTDNKLTGYQVMADKDFKSDFIEKFNIAAIPRFILIDPAGNVVDADAKRPSDPALKKQFDQLLK